VKLILIYPKQHNEEKNGTDILISEVAVENGLRSIIFPSISTGAFCFPMHLAAPIALRAIIEFLQTQPHELELVRMVFYTREVPESYAIYAHTLQQIVEDGQMPRRCDKETSL
jgi:O-acetyl-ADP-ribose deacetylase (regulator of RNase III)